jgi:hypothetical protein
VITVAPRNFVVKMPAEYTEWMAAFNWIANLDFVGLAVPPRCLGSYEDGLLVRGVLPLCVLALLAAAFLLHAIVRRRSLRGELLAALPLALWIIYLSVPSISAALFNAFPCAAYGYDDATGESRRYLRADLSLYCGPSSEPTSEYETLVNLAIVLLVIWPLGAPLLFTAVQHQNRAAITERVPTDLSRAAAFLWRDYKPEYWWWESAELLRKLTLTGFVLLIPQEQAMLRLLVAQLVALGALVLYTMCRPFADILDNGLAAIAHAVLVFFLVACAGIKQCGVGGEGGDELCDAVGGSKLALASASFSGIVVILALLAIAVGFEMYAAVERQRETDRWSTTSMVPPHCDWQCKRRYAVFLSHYKAETASLARYLHDLLRKMLREPIYLDSSTLTDLRSLFEDGVDRSEVLVLICSAGVLTRPWCLLELLEASRRRVPVVPLLIEAPEAWNPAAMRRLAANLEGELAALNPQALPMLHEHCGNDLSELQSVLTAVIDAADASTAVRWNPGAGDNEIIAQLKELCERMAAPLGREIVWSDAAAGTASSSGRSGRARPLALISCHHAEALAHARVLMATVSERARRPVHIARLATTGGAASGVSGIDALIVLLTPKTLLDEGCLSEVHEALERKIPVVPVLIVGSGYSHAEAKAYLQVLQSPYQALLNAALPNLIAINWSPDRGGYHVSAVIDDVLARCQLKAAEPLSRRLSRSASRKSSVDVVRVGRGDAKGEVNAEPAAPMAV